MDIVIRFWDSSMNKVCSRYLPSSFTGHSTAEDIMNNFLEASSEMKLFNLIQVSMDGPNVNWSFFEQLSSDLHNEYATTILFLGSCGLHVINGSLTTGHKATNWKVQVQLKSFFKLFKDSPARQADYIDFTGCNQFPKKFCSVRWVENVEACERAQEVFKQIKLYISKAKKLSNTFTVKTVKKACADPLAEAKIAFFCSVASALEPFLRRFQTDAPMAPFLYAELFNVLLVLMKRFIKRDLMDKATTPQQLSKLDVNSKKSLKEPKDVDVGIEAKGFLSNASISANEKLLFRKECRDFLVATVAKIFEKSPLRHKITRAIASIVPATMINARSISEKGMEILVQILFERKWLSAVVADKAKAQFSQLCSRA